MKKLILIAALAALPLATLGGEPQDFRAAPSHDAAQASEAMPGDGQASSYTCCWVMVLGKWWCLPCY
jgi:hypothetical protein